MDNVCMVVGGAVALALVGVVVAMICKREESEKRVCVCRHHECPEEEHEGDFDKVHEAFEEAGTGVVDDSRVITHEVVEKSESVGQVVMDDVVHVVHEVPEVAEDVVKPVKRVLKL